MIHRDGEGGMIIDNWEEMIKEFCSMNYSKVEIRKKYHGQTVEHEKILTWMRILGFSDNKKFNLKEISLGFIRQELPIWSRQYIPEYPAIAVFRKLKRMGI